MKTEQLWIRGGKILNGEIEIQGAKNSVLPILAASILNQEPVKLLRCPKLRDVEMSIKILKSLGCQTVWDGDDLIINAKYINNWRVSEDLTRQMRSSVIFLGAILARFGKAVCSMPGGCELGPRPIDLHLSGLREMGVEIQEDHGELNCETACLRGCEIVLSTPSVGATENLMLAACGASGVTRISNAAREPEIIDLQDFLNACGADITGAGSDIIIINNKNNNNQDGELNPARDGLNQAGEINNQFRGLRGCTYRVMPDRIVAATYLYAAASAGGEIFLKNAREKDMAVILSRLRECGCEIIANSDGIGIKRDPGRRLKAPRETVKTAPYPGFPTDAQSVFMAAVLKAEGCTVFEENLFESRYRHADELKRMGADIKISGRMAAVRGVKYLKGASVACTDLRGGAALCIAALAADGVTRIDCLKHIDRGYEDICRDLSALGAEITRREI